METSHVCRAWRRAFGALSWRLQTPIIVMSVNRKGNAQGVVAAHPSIVIPWQDCDVSM